MKPEELNEGMRVAFYPAYGIQEGSKKNMPPVLIGRISIVNHFTVELLQISKTVVWHGTKKQTGKELALIYDTFKEGYTHRISTDLVMYETRA